jgi:hypothetical protein
LIVVKSAFSAVWRARDVEMYLLGGTDRGVRSRRDILLLAFMLWTLEVES